MSFIWKGHFNRRNANVCDSDRTHSHLWRTRSHFLICMTFSRALPRSIKGLVVDYKWEPWRTTWMCIFTHSRVWVVCLLRDSSSITCEDRDVPDGWRKGLIHVCLLRDSSSITSQDRDVTYGCGTWLIRVCPWRESSSSTNEDCGVTKGCRTWLIHMCPFRDSSVITSEDVTNEWGILTQTTKKETHNQFSIKTLLSKKDARSVGRTGLPLRDAFPLRRNSPTFECVDYKRRRDKWIRDMTHSHVSTTCRLLSPLFSPQVPS